jgi:serine/threonine protein phosphatase 1
MSRTIVIGDIHGCLDALNSIVDAFSPSSSDTIITVGDYVDRGPNSKGVLDRLLELETTCNLIALKGNHEEMMMEVLEGRVQPYSWLNYGGVETMDSYGFIGDLGCVPKSHRDFISRMPLYHETDSHFIVHANYAPDLALDEQPIEMLLWAKISSQLPGPHFSGKRAVVGHTHDREGRVFEVPHLICIDTYCYGGRWLTGFELETGNLWQSDPAGKLIRRPEQ